MENELNEFLLEHKPSSKGWLQRLSRSKPGKWSRLFFFTNPHTNTLLSVKPTEIKVPTYMTINHSRALTTYVPPQKDLNVGDVELYRCSFVEEMENKLLVQFPATGGT